jgi:hypothetical protein
VITESLAKVVEALEDEGYAVTEPVPGALLVRGRFSNAERIALQAAATADDQRIAVWAWSHRDDWALVCWERPQLVTITERDMAPLRWRHRVLPATLQPNAQTFLEGASSPYDIVTRPKHQPTDEARAILAGFDITDPAPPGWEPPVVEAPIVVKSTVSAGATRARPAATRAPRAPRAPRASTAKPEPTVNVCPHCFMAIPATGICDNCG